MVMLSVQVPFAGFYDSIWSQEIDHQQEQLLAWEDWDNFTYAFPELAHIPKDEIDIQRLREAGWFKAFNNSECEGYIAKQYTASFAHWLAYSLDVKKLRHEFEEMTSPREYNFTTDRIFAKFPESAFVLMRKRLGEDALAKSFKEKFTSCPGFHSFYTNETPEKPLSEWDHNELYALLEAWVDHYLEGHESIDWTLFEDMTDDVYTAVDAATDFDQLHEIAAEIAEEWLADKRDLDPDFLPPVPRCQYTLELPF